MVNLSMCFFHANTGKTQWKDVFLLPAPSLCQTHPVCVNMYHVVRQVSSPMILTGYAALNKLLGKNVYQSQARVGCGSYQGYDRHA